MPSVTFAHGVASAPDLFLTGLEDLALAATVAGGVTKVSATGAVVTIAEQTFHLSGTDLVWTRAYGIRVLTGGTLDEVRLADTGVRQVTLTGLGLDLATLRSAALTEASSADPGAIEALLYPLTWTYQGSAAPDQLLPDAVSADLVPRNLGGDDAFHLKGGFVETFFSGDGDDTVLGGGGIEVL